MGARFYDEALLEKIKGWLKDSNVKITGVNETKRLFEYIADTSNDSPIELPLIALRKSPDMTILSPVKKPLTYDGQMFEASLENRKSASLNGIPVSLKYNIDIYTRYYDQADEYVRNFIFNLINYPKFQIRIPYNGAEIIHNANIQLDTSVVDNSDIPERMIAGQFTRFTLTFSVDDAYLFDYKIQDTWAIGDVEVEALHSTEIK